MSGDDTPAAPRAAQDQSAPYPAQDANPRDAQPVPDAPRAAPNIDRRMLESLVCPLTHGPLEFAPVASELISRKAGLAFQIRDGIPIMLESEARVLEA